MSTEHSLHTNEQSRDKDGVFKWLAMGTEIPIMVFLGAFIGYVVGQRLGSPFEYVGLTLGAFLGFAVSVIPLFSENRTTRKPKLSR